MKTNILDTRYRTQNETALGVILSKSIIFLTVIFTLYLIYLNFSYSIRNNVLVYGILVVPVFALIYFIAYKLNISPLKFAITIFVLAFLMKGLLATLVDTKPISDFNAFYSYAIKLLNGDKSFGDSLYFKTWAYQTGPIIYYAAIMKLFGTGLLALKLVNCFFMAGTNVLIYLLARKLSNDYTARFVALLYLLYPAPYFLASVLTNQHFAACMFLLSVYILLSNRMNFAVKGVFAGVIMSLGNAVRPLGVVIIVAAIAWGLLNTIKLKKLAQLGIIAVLLISYLFMNFGISALVKYSGTNAEGLKNNFPLWKFVIGFNYDSQGRFSYEDQDKIFYIQDFDQRDSVAKEVIKERLSIEPRKLIGLINTKQKIMWSDFDTMRWGFYQQIDGKLVAPKNLEKYEAGILRIERVFYILIFIFMFLGLCIALIFKRIGTEVLLISIMLMCYFGVHALIEIQVRYRYFAVMLVFILAAKGAELLFSGLKAYREKYSLAD